MTDPFSGPYFSTRMGRLSAVLNGPMDEHYPYEHWCWNLGRLVLGSLEAEFGDQVLRGKRFPGCTRSTPLFFHAAMEEVSISDEANSLSLCQFNSIDCVVWYQNDETRSRIQPIELRRAVLYWIEYNLNLFLNYTVNSLQIDEICLFVDSTFRDSSTSHNKN